MTRLKPVPTGSTKTRSVKREPRRLVLRRAAAAWSGASRPAGSRRAAARQRPCAGTPTTRPGPPLKTNVTGRSWSSPVSDVRDGEDLGRGLLLLAQDDPLRAVAVYSIAVASAAPRSRGPGAGRRLVVGLRSRCRRSSRRRSWARTLPHGREPLEPDRGDRRIHLRRHARRRGWRGAAPARADGRGRARGRGGARHLRGRRAPPARVRRLRSCRRARGGRGAYEAHPARRARSPYSARRSRSASFSSSRRSICCRADARR